jgi:tetratricopeptide (TPR) repeat protein
LESAISDLRTALNDQPRSPELLTLLALAYERGGQIDLADKQLADATRASSFDPAFGLNYVSFLQRRDLNSHAEDMLSELASRHPRNVAVLTRLAQAKLTRQDWVGAHELATLIRKIGDGSGVAAQIEAASLSGQKRFDEGIRILQEAQAANPNSVQPVFGIVRSYIQAKQPEKAEAFLQSMLKINQQNADAHVLLGYTRLAMRQPLEAAKSFRAAIRLQPGNASAYRALAEQLLGEGRIDEAMSVLEEGLQHAPGNFGLRLARASVLETKSEFRAAIALYEEMLREEPGALIVANNYASLVSDHMADKDALERAYNAALALNRSHVPQFKDTLGWLLFLREDHRRALPLLEEAAEKLPNVAAVQYHLGMVYKAVGETEKATARLKQALALETQQTPLQQKIRDALKSLPVKDAG